MWLLWGNWNLVMDYLLPIWDPMMIFLNSSCMEFYKVMGLFITGILSQFLKYWRNQFLTVSLHLVISIPQMSGKSLCIVRYIKVLVMPFQKKISWVHFGFGSCSLLNVILKLIWSSWFCLNRSSHYFILKVFVVLFELNDW